MIWKYTDASQQAVVRTNADGSAESCLISVITDWLAAGNTPIPADPPNPNTPILAQLQSLDAPFTPRRMREFMRASLENEATALAATPEAVPLGVDLASRKAAILGMNPAYRLVVQADNAAIAARALLTPPLV